MRLSTRNRSDRCASDHLHFGKMFQKYAQFSRFLCRRSSKVIRAIRTRQYQSPSTNTSMSLVCCLLFVHCACLIATQHSSALFNYVSCMWDIFRICV